MKATSDRGITLNSDFAQIRENDCKRKNMIINRKTAIKWEYLFLITLSTSTREQGEVEGRLTLS